MNHYTKRARRTQSFNAGVRAGAQLPQVAAALSDYRGDTHVKSDSWADARSAILGEAEVDGSGHYRLGVIAGMARSAARQ